MGPDPPGKEGVDPTPGLPAIPPSQPDRQQAMSATAATTTAARSEADRRRTAWGCAWERPGRSRDRRGKARGSGLWRGERAPTLASERGSGGRYGTNDQLAAAASIDRVEGYRPAGDFFAYGRGCAVSDHLWRRNRTLRGRLGVGRGAAPPDGGNHPALAKATTAPALAHTSR